VNRPIGIDLFAGAGGLSLGFEQAGFDVVAAVEIDPIHAAVHSFNFPQCAVVPRSIADVTGTELRRVAGIGRHHIDVVFGGAPCQGFSLIGHRIFEDPRNALVREFVRVVGELRPSYFVFENVKGLTVGQHRDFLYELIEAFAAIGYHLRLPWTVLNAAHYCVPQHRERLILFGAREGLPLPEYPFPLCHAADSSPRRSLPQGPTCEDALGDLPDADIFEALWDSDEVETVTWGPPSPYARELRCQSKDSWHSGHPREWNPKLLTSSNRTDHSEISQRRFAQTGPGSVEPISRFFKLAPDGLSNTLRAGTDSARGAFTSPRPIHYRWPRCVTVREMARLHGFPDWFRFHATKWHGARQIGNSVPPPLARAVALEVMKVLGGDRSVCPQEKISLGNPALLRMDMTQAAEYFGVPIPIGKRDRKSGVKKRKQHEIEAILEPLREEEAVIA
jgi:DNA (cytosine-5)-methyltransferase 1